MPSQSFQRTEPGRLPGQEPIDGYRLLARLGRGGFGEVWKCEAPGGLHKAIKFVTPGTDSAATSDRRLQQEFEAFERIKAIRHPFLLMLDRVELLGGELVMVMELADKSLDDLFRECRAAGLSGVPRDDLLVFLADAAEALDTIAEQYHLQHLDVKPANLFVVGGHAKLGDFGLVRRTGGEAVGFTRTLTPRYACPEACAGEVSPRSDQYSLALVYAEMLTGRFPYEARSVREMMDLHRSGEPDLGGLPAADRPAVARALAKPPGDRFASCTEFVRSLVHGVTNPPPTTRSALIRFVTRRDDSTPPPPTRPATTDFVLLTTVAGDTSPVAQLARAFPGHRFIEELEYGHRGRVVRAVDPSGRVRVVRLVTVDAKEDAEAAVRLAGVASRANPAQMVSALHPRLVGYSHDDQCVSLREFRRHRDLTGTGLGGPELLAILAGAAAVLDGTADACGIGHLLVRPESIVVGTDGGGVLDYGLGELLRLTSPDVGWVGTDPYTAPELKTGRPGRASDQYSLACVFLEMAGAWEPKPRRGLRVVSPLAELNPARPLPDWQLAALRRALHADPAQRFESCGEFVAALGEETRRVRLDAVRPLVPVARLDGTGDGDVPLTPAGFLEHLLLTVCGTDDLPDLRTPPVLTQAGQYRCRFPSPPSRTAVEQSLDALKREWSFDWTAEADGEYRLRLLSSRSFWSLRKAPDIEVGLTLLGGTRGRSGSSGEAELSAAQAGAPAGYKGPGVLPFLIAVRNHLQSATADRRRTFRVPARMDAVVYPLGTDRDVRPPVAARCQDISAGGFRLTVATAPDERHAYVRFPTVDRIGGLAILARLFRSDPSGDGQFTLAGQFFTDE